MQAMDIAAARVRSALQAAASQSRSWQVAAWVTALQPAPSAAQQPRTPECPHAASPADGCAAACNPMSSSAAGTNAVPALLTFHHRHQHPQNTHSHRTMKSQSLGSSSHSWLGPGRSIHRAMQASAHVSAITGVRMIAAAAAGDAGSEEASVDQGRPFVDSVRLEVHGGNGGAGCVAFVRIQKGGGGGQRAASTHSDPCSNLTGRRQIPTGGPGGRGGDVVLRASHGVTGLSAIPAVVRAPQGGKGGPNGKAGRAGLDRVVYVPVGTVIHVMDTPQVETETSLATGSGSKPLRHQNSKQGSMAVQASPDSGADTTNCARRARQQEAGQQGVGEGPMYLQGAQEHPNPEGDSLHLDGNQGEGEDEGEAGEEEHDEGEEPTGEAGDDLQHAHKEKGKEDTSEESRPASPWLSLRVARSVELLREGEEAVVGRGGAGGLGNAGDKRAGPPWQRKSAGEEGMLWQQAMRRASPGEVGGHVRVLLELRLLADVGLVGMPNVGKSSLLRALTAARAQVGDYAFTTLRPQLGALAQQPPSTQQQQQQQPFSRHIAMHQVQPSGELAAQDLGWSAHSAAGQGDQNHESRSSDAAPLIVADIPGLVEGAHANHGRGNAFLRHVARCAAVALVVDLSGGGSSSLLTLSPVQQLRILQVELQAYNAATTSTAEPQQALGDAVAGLPSHASLLPRATLPKPCLVIANKVDACEDPKQALAQLAAATPLPILPVSARKGAGLARLAAVMRAVVDAQGVQKPVKPGRAATSK